MFSQTANYAIRAMIEIATRPAGENVLSSQLGEALDIPTHYLAKILQQLVRARVLTSIRGRQGGFALAKASEKIKLKEIVAPFEDLRKYEECVLGQPVCSEAGACPLHEFWSDVRTRYMDELTSKTLADLRDFQMKRIDGMSAGLRNKLPSVPGMEMFRESRKS